MSNRSTDGHVLLHLHIRPTWISMPTYTPKQSLLCRDLTHQSGCRERTKQFRECRWIQEQQESQSGFAERSGLPLQRTLPLLLQSLRSSLLPLNLHPVSKKRLLPLRLTHRLQQWRLCHNPQSRPLSLLRLLQQSRSLLESQASRHLNPLLPHQRQRNLCLLQHQ